MKDTSSKRLAPADGASVGSNLEVSKAKVREQCVARARQEKAIPLWGFIWPFGQTFGLCVPPEKEGRLSCFSSRQKATVSIHTQGPVTTDFLELLCKQVQVQGKRVLLLIWDNASWHAGKQIKTWLREHNQAVQKEAHTDTCGVCIIPCWFPVKSP